MIEINQTIKRYKQQNRALKMHRKALQAQVDVWVLEVAKLEEKKEELEGRLELINANYDEFNVKKVLKNIEFTGVANNYHLGDELDAITSILNEIGRPEETDFIQKEGSN